MNDWKSIKARRQATYDFSRYLEENPDKLPENSNDAKRLFADIGKFYVEGDKRQAGDEGFAEIKLKTEFKIYPFDRIEDRDLDMVCLILPKQPMEKDPVKFEPTRVWVAGWSPYID